MGRKSREKVMSEFSLDLVYRESLKLYQNALNLTDGKFPTPCYQDREE
jgi:hypothetical protein